MESRKFVKDDFFQNVYWEVTLDIEKEGYWGNGKLHQEKDVLGIEKVPKNSVIYDLEDELIDKK